MIPALIAGGAALLGGFMSNEASAKSADKQMAFQSAANQQSMDFSAGQTQKQMDFAAGQTQAQMDFQERMANSAHQREVSDLRSAGLNPILSVNRSGAPAPAGAAASGSAAQGVTSAGASYRAENPAASAAGSALQAMSIQDVLASIQVKDAQADLTRAQAETERNRPENVAADTDVKRKQQQVQDSEWFRNTRQGVLYDIQGVIQRETGIPLAQAQAIAAKALASLNAASAKSADIKANLDAYYGGIEREVEIGRKGTEALKNITPWKGVFK